MDFRHNVTVGAKIDCVKITGTNGGRCPGATREAEVFLVADNVYGVLDLSLVSIPDGYERAGDNPEEWFREPVVGETVLGAPGTQQDGNASVHGAHWYIWSEDRRRIILRKKVYKKRFLVVDHELQQLGPVSLYSYNGSSSEKIPFHIEEREA